MTLKFIYRIKITLKVQMEINMKIIKSRIFIGIASIAVISTAFLVFGKGFIGKSQGTLLQYKEFKVYKGNFKIDVSANGMVIPIDRVEIKSKASGQIVDLAVEEGDFVKRGDLIARLDQRDEKAEVAQAQANLTIAQAELKQAERSFDRRDELFKRNRISEEERDQIVLSLAVANGKLVQATTALDRARERLSEAVVRAPIDGIILQKYVEEGQIIASGVSNVSGGTPIVDIAEMNSVYIEAGIDEIDIGKVQVGQTAMVVADAYPDTKFRGKIVRISPEARIEQNVTLFDVIVEVENMDGKLKSGMNSTLEITIVDRNDILLAPSIVFQTVNSSMPGSGRGNFQRNSGAVTARNVQGANQSAMRANTEKGTQKLKGDNQQKVKTKTVLLKEGKEFVSRTVEIGASNFKEVFRIKRRRYPRSTHDIEIKS
jgi:HlyD family secretion protein